MSCDYCWPGNCCGGPNCKDATPPATSPARPPERYDADAAELIGIVKQLQTYAPSQLLPLLVVARSMMKEGDQQL